MNQLRQLVRLDGLGQVRIESALECTSLDLLLSPARQCNERDILKIGLLMLALWH